MKIISKKKHILLSWRKLLVDMIHSLHEILRSNTMLSICTYYIQLHNRTLTLLFNIIDKCRRQMKKDIGVTLGLKDNAQNISQKQQSEITLVISFCNSNLLWVREYISKDYRVGKIDIYSKCNGKPEKAGIQELQSFFGVKPNVTILKNVGRNDHSYALHISEHYNSIAKSESLNTHLESHSKS